MIEGRSCNELPSSPSCKEEYVKRMYETFMQVTGGELDIPCVLQDTMFSG